MRIVDALEIVTSTFAHNRMRTFLTVFAISIGMGAIMILVSLGFGLQKLIIQRISSSQALLTFSLTSNNADILKIDNTMVDKIRSVLEVETVGLNYTLSGRLTYSDSQTDTAMNLVDTNFLRLEDINFENGKAYADDNSDETLIISDAAAKSLGFSDPQKALGETISATSYFDAEDTSKTGDASLKVVGITNDSDSSIAYVPISKFKLPDGIQITTVKAKVKNSQVAAATRKQFEGMGLNVYSVTETIGRMNRIFLIIQYVLAAFGLIALFVASIGMFNTLTISLLERTREIGIMRVLGATASDIKKIFLIEAIIMGLGGGAFGLGCGWILTFILNTMVSNLATNLGGEPTKPFFTPWYFTVFILVISLLIGFLTGFYPARRAARLNPLDALRYE